MPRTSTKLADEPIYFSPAALGSWLSKNHATKTELWVGYFKKHTGRQALTWPLAVDEALCWGWIDGIKKRVDADRTMQRFTPRKAKSHWSAVNVAKVAVLEAAGRMQEPGRAAFALRTEENTGQTSFESRTRCRFRGSLRREAGGGACGSRVAYEAAAGIPTDC
ncbi:hypothetical protein B0H14DRAFT_956616 [Mycena olivaceomarginata]|nr:hypothetical protein B0H14DRAFT_956616 [Mycena olivaceomarginata]